jgi:flagellar motor switch protein FliG
MSIALLYPLGFRIDGRPFWGYSGAEGEGEGGDDDKGDDPGEKPEDEPETDLAKVQKALAAEREAHKASRAEARGYKTVLRDAGVTGLDALKWMDPRAVADLVRNEHPQIIAIVMAHLETDQAADALKLLPERTRVDVLLRIATLDGIPPNALNELNEIMERQFAGNQNLKSSNIGGVQCAANILNFMDSGQDQAILGEIARIDAPLSGRIQDLMFVFDDLVDLDDRELQLVLREVSGERLGLALRGADIKVRDKITRNMSQRAAEIRLEDMEARGPVRLSDVEVAQREILAIVKRMADEGTVTIGGNAEAML